MKLGGLTLVVGCAAVGTPALADQPLGVPPSTVCSLSGSVCASREATGVAIWRKLPRGVRRPLWRAPTRSANFQVADDGLSLVDIQPWANLVEMNAGRGTTIFTFYRPRAAPVSVTLGQMIRNVAALPRTTSHRNWARTFGYDGLGHFQVDTVEGRRILFDPRTGRPVRH